MTNKDKLQEFFSKDSNVVAKEICDGIDYNTCHFCIYHYKTPNECHHRSCINGVKKWLEQEILS